MSIDATGATASCSLCSSGAGDTDAKRLGVFCDVTAGPTSSSHSHLYCTAAGGLHAVHWACARDYILKHAKAVSEATARHSFVCPVCTGGQPPAAPSNVAVLTTDGEEAVGGAARREGKEGVARNHFKQRYTCYVHVIEADGLTLGPKNTKDLNPVCALWLASFDAFYSSDTSCLMKLLCVVQYIEITAFGQTRKTKIGDHGSTFACLWDQTFQFEGSFTEPEFEAQSIVLSVSSYEKWSFVDPSVGQVRLEAAQIMRAPDHEQYRYARISRDDFPLLSFSFFFCALSFYLCVSRLGAVLRLCRVWRQINAIDGSAFGAVRSGGKVQLSVCVVSNQQFVDGFKLKHIYDLEGMCFAFDVLVQPLLICEWL